MGTKPKSRAFSYKSDRAAISVEPKMLSCRDPFQNLCAAVNFSMKDLIMRIASIAAVLLALEASGCSTLANGSTDEIYVVSDPPGATATLSSGEICLTPCKFDVNRKDDTSVSIEKTGYEGQNIQIKTQSIASPAATSPAFTSDYFGRVFDHQNGANLIHTPNPVSVKLKSTSDAPAG